MLEKNVAVEVARSENTAEKNRITIPNRYCNLTLGTVILLKV